MYMTLIREIEKTAKLIKHSGTREENFVKGFYQIWDRRSSWSCD